MLWAEAHQPDAILLDVMLPELGGTDVLRRLKGTAATKSIPVIIVSAIDDSNRKWSLAADDYIVKPIDSERLRAALKRVLSRPTFDIKRVAIVDDDPAVLELISECLHERGYKVVEFQSGQELLNVLCQSDDIEWSPDLVILDLQMPGKNGFDLVNDLKQNPAWSEIPIIILTSRNISSEDLKKLNRRFHSLIEKGGLSRDLVLDKLIEQLELLQGEAVLT